MLDTFIDQYATATITLAQTTYLDLAVTTGTFRVHYRDKAEFLVRNGANGVLAYCSEHPLLWDYNGPWNTLYVSGAAPDPPALVNALQRAVATASHQWRALDRYLFGSNEANSLALLEQNLAEGGGLLLEGAPGGIAQAVSEICQQHDSLQKLYLNSRHLSRFTIQVSAQHCAAVHCRGGYSGESSRSSCAWSDS